MRNARDQYLKKKYGISLRQYNDLLKKQNDCCAVCGKHKSLEKKSFAVDHDHVTGRIRGILCFTCNHRVVGRHRNPDLLEAAARYLRQGTDWFVPKRKRK